MQMPYVHPQMRHAGELADATAEGVLALAHAASLRLKRRRGRFGYVRRPGADTPLWNDLALDLRGALRPYGAKVRLARYLGIPKQRLTDYLRSRDRLPDAELTLELLHWLTELRRGRDLSV